MTAARRMLAVAQDVLRAVGRPIVAGGLLVGGLGAGPVAAQTEVIEYYGQDALGSIRVVFDASGVATARADFEPFGELFTVPGMPGGPLPAEQFTGQARDPEASADYFGARFYTPRTGRFSQVDPVYAGLFDPQQWNRYAYVRNNPLSFIDPDGRAAKSREDFPCSYILSINSQDSPCTFLMGGGGLSTAASTGTDMRTGGPNGGGSGKGGSSGSRNGSSAVGEAAVETISTLVRWVLGTSPKKVTASKAASQALSETPAFQQTLARYEREGCNDAGPSGGNGSRFYYNNFQYSQLVRTGPNVVGQAVGSFATEFTSLPGGQVAVHARNTWGLESGTRFPAVFGNNRWNSSVQQMLLGGAPLMYPKSLLEDRTSGGMMSNVTVDYYWIQASPCPH